MPSAALQSVLDGRFAEFLRFRPKLPHDTLPSGIPDLDFPRGAGHAERALKVTDLIVQGGGFGMVAMDLGQTPPETARRIPPASWFRFRHAVQNSRSVLLVIEQVPCARSCAAQSLEMSRETVTWSGT